MTTWKRGDRVYLTNAPDITGTVFTQDDEGIVTVVTSSCQPVFAPANALEWYTRPSQPNSEFEGWGPYIEINARSGFHYGWLAFFSKPERIAIDRLAANGKTSLEESYGACPDCDSDDFDVREYDFGMCQETGYRDAGERGICRNCGSKADICDFTHKGNREPEWAAQVSAQMLSTFGPRKDWDFYRFNGVTSLQEAEAA